MVEIQMNKFTVQELADFYQKLADGSKIDYALLPKDSFGHPENGPHLGCSKDVWRIKPSEKVIDLSVLIESGIDCEFSLDGETWCVDILAIVLNNGRYSGVEYSEWNYCRPRMNHIHAWQGGECPLPEGFIVKVWLRDNYYDDGGGALASEMVWFHDNTAGDIIAFEVLEKLADDYVMPGDLCQPLEQGNG
jgi:hypothetical protein